MAGNQVEDPFRLQAGVQNEDTWEFNMLEKWED
jgi:hypothetical protein